MKSWRIFWIRPLKARSGSIGRLIFRLGAEGTVNCVKFCEMIIFRNFVKTCPLTACRSPRCSVYIAHARRADVAEYVAFLQADASGPTFLQIRYGFGTHSYKKVGHNFFEPFQFSRYLSRSSFSYARLRLVRAAAHADAYDLSTPAVD